MVTASKKVLPRWRRNCKKTRNTWTWHLRRSDRNFTNWKLRIKQIQVSLKLDDSLWFLYRNSKASRINTGRRFKTPLCFNPGPGQYDEIGNIGQSVHSLSNYQTPRVKNLRTTEQRPEWSIPVRMATPGPGTYRPPSDFGYMDMKYQDE